MAYITVAEVAAIRDALKAEFGKTLKFGVRRNHGSEVVVTIKSGTVDFGSLWADRKPGDYAYGNIMVNQYHVTEENYGPHVEMFNKIFDIIRQAPGTIEGGTAHFDDSDSMTDYFHCAYYFTLNVGSWDKPYQMVTK